MTTTPPDTEDRSRAEAAEIVPGLWYVGSYSCCAYLLHTDEGPVLIDSCDRRAGDDFLAQIRRAGVDPASVVAVLHTHGHADHTGNTAEVVRLSGARAMIGAGDMPWLAEQTEVARAFCPGETVTFGETQIEYFAAAGHTLGCGMYLTTVGRDRVCFMGDSCGPFIFEAVRWAGDAEAFRASAERMKGVEAYLFLPGHPDQIREVSAEGDPRLSREQWHQCIAQRVEAMEGIISGRGRLRLSRQRRSRRRVADSRGSPAGVAAGPDGREGRAGALTGEVLSCPEHDAGPAELRRPGTRLTPDGGQRPGPSGRTGVSGMLVGTRNHQPRAGPCSARSGEAATAWGRGVL